MGMRSEKGKMERPAGRVAVLSMMVALALILSYLENLIPLPLGLPGIKLGLANLVVLLALYLLGRSEALLVSLVRILLAGLLFGNAAALAYSLSGGILSLLVMMLVKRCQRFSLYGVSMAGGVTHNIGQILVAALLLRSIRAAYYLPALILAGLVTGALLGLVMVRLLPLLERSGQI